MKKYNELEIQSQTTNFLLDEIKHYKNHDVRLHECLRCSEFQTLLHVIEKEVRK